MGKGEITWSDIGLVEQKMKFQKTLSYFVNTLQALKNLNKKGSELRVSLRWR